jgi:hypothetical protein
VFDLILGGGEWDYQDVAEDKHTAGVSVHDDGGGGAAAAAAAAASTPYFNPLVPSRPIPVPPEPPLSALCPHQPICRYTAFSESWVTAYKIPMHFIDECDTLTCRSLVTTPNLFSMRPLKPSRQHP